MKEITSLQSSKILENGPIRCVIEFTWAYGNSTLIQKMVLYSKNYRIDFETKVDWHERDQLLKAAFPVDIRATEATYDIQYGNVKRRPIGIQAGIMPALNQLAINGLIYLKEDMV
jgi:alpha-mannosidase